MRNLAILAPSLLVCLGGIGFSRNKASQPVVRLVKYDGMTEEVLKHRGKVVLVDFWSTLCVPCRKKFPDLLAMQEKYRKDGFVFLPVSLDNIDEDNPAEMVKEKVRKDLEFLKAPESLLLEGWEPIVKEKLHFDGTIPCMFLFNREGKWIKYGGAVASPEFTTQDLEKQVVEFLKAK